MRPKDFTTDCWPYVRWAQHKLNGHRILVQRSVRNGIQIHGRTSNYSDKVLEIKHLRKLLERLPDECILDAELCTLTSQSTDVPHLLDIESEALTIVPFRILSVNNVDYSSMWNLEEANTHIKSLGFNHPTTFHLDQKLKDKERLLDYIQQHRLEGLVLKGGHHKDWYKLKPESTIDAVIVYINPGKGKFRDKMGSITVALLKEGRLVAISDVGSGFTMDQRVEMLQRPPIHEVVEIKYSGRATQGGLLHPRFIRFRPDKPWQECTMEQLK